MPSEISQFCGCGESTRPVPPFAYLYNGIDQASILDLLEGIPGRGLHRSGCEEVWLLNTRTQTTWPPVEVTHNSVHTNCQ